MDRRGEKRRRERELSDTDRAVKRRGARAAKAESGEAKGAWSPKSGLEEEAAKDSASTMPSGLESLEHPDTGLGGAMVPKAHTSAAKEAQSPKAGLDSVSKQIDPMTILPQEIASNIVGRLDVIDGVRVTALSHDWRSIWRSIPLGLDDTQLGVGTLGKRLLILNKILNSHPGPVTRLSLSLVRLGENIMRLDEFFRNSMLNHLHELELDFPNEIRNACVVRYNLPRSALRFTSVAVIRISNCKVQPTTQLLSQTLLVFELRKVYICTATLQNLLAGCKKLQTLRLIHNSGYCRLTIRNEEIREISVLLHRDKFLDDSEMGNLLVENGKDLRLLFIDQFAHGPKVTIIKAPGLQSLGYLGLETPTLQIENSFFKKSVASKLPDRFHTVRVLALKLFHTNPGCVVDYLHLFPSLATLHIRFIPPGPRYGYPEDLSPGGESLYSPDKTIHCVETTLKTISFWYYDTKEPPFELINYFIESAQVLDRLIFAADVKAEKIWPEDMCRKLSREWASSEIELMFGLVYSPPNWLLQLDLKDPFNLQCSFFHSITLKK